MKMILISLLALFGTFANAATEPAKVTDKAKKTTDANFDDILVQGRYNFSDEAVTTVEDDKVLDALLSVRKDFSDRVKKSKEQQ